MSAVLHVKFWGVRGSVPAPGATTVKYGGNTSCVEVRANGQIAILDAGTGIRLLGRALKTEGLTRSADLTLFLTHTHWDHIQGLPFFITLLDPGSRLTIMGCEGAREGLATLLARHMESPFFPVPLQGSGATISIQELPDPEFTHGELCVRTLRANHPGSCVGYRLEHAGKSMAYFPDNESFLGRARALGLQSGDPQWRRAEQHHKGMVDFLRGTDLLVMDAQYDRSEYGSHVGWGHGCVDDVVALALEAEVRRLVLFHHDPDHNDEKVAAMAAAAQAQAQEAGGALIVEAAREGHSISIGS